MYDIFIECLWIYTSLHEHKMHQNTIFLIHSYLPRTNRNLKWNLMRQMLIQSPFTLPPFSKIYPSWSIRPLTHLIESKSLESITKHSVSWQPTNPCSHTRTAFPLGLPWWDPILSCSNSFTKALWPRWTANSLVFRLSETPRSFWKDHHHNMI